MKGFVRLMAVVVTAAVFVVACSKDKDSGKITLDSPAVFFAQAGGSATVGFTAQNIKTLSATSKPTGWDEAVVDLAGAMISVKAPSSEDIESGDAVKTGSFSFTGYTPGGTLVSATLFAGIVTTKDISAEVANSYIVTEPETNYLIDATRKGDGSQLATSYVDVVWQTASGFVQYADFEDGKASFYIGADSDDATKIKQGNAVIGAYDADGELIWSWHIWATDYDPDAEGGTVDFNGYTLMNRNLGALANDNSTTDKILASYGLYYQWGRKDPFIGPNTYQGSEGSGASMYSGSGSRVYLKCPSRAPRPERWNMPSGTRSSLLRVWQTRTTTGFGAAVPTSCGRRTTMWPTRALTTPAPTAGAWLPRARSTTWRSSEPRPWATRRNTAGR